MPGRAESPFRKDRVRKVRILLVDDNESVRRAVRSLLAFQDDLVVCAEASDGLEALDRAREVRPDVIFMDVSMPRMDGLQATRHLRREFPETKIILISQNDHAVVRRQTADVKADAFVPKAELARDLLPTLSALFADHPPQDPPVQHVPARIAPQAQAHGLFGGGTMGRLIREYDWSQTSLGPIDQWQPSLRNSVNLMLNSHHPMWIGWGPEMMFLYNDAYVSVLSLAKHPWALGRPTREVWAEIWDVVGELANRVFAQGEPTFVDNVRLFMARGEALEETYYSFSYSPIYDELGKVAGLFCPSTETSADVLHARRLQTLSELSAKALVEKSPPAACATLLGALAGNPNDIPFALLYLAEEQASFATLEGSSHIGESAALAPRRIPLHGDAALHATWPVTEVLKSGQVQAVSLRHLEAPPLGPAAQPVVEALTLPLASAAGGQAVGVLIVGVNPTRRLDSEYRTFFTLVADQVATAVQNARAAQQEKQRIEALAQIDAAKTAFFSNVSHEFRTPLTLMLAPLQDLLSRGQAHLSPAAKEQLELASRNGSRLLRLVNTLLDFSRIEAGRSRAVYEASDISSLTADLASVFRSASDRAGLTLSVDCAPIGEPVYLDRDMWEKIVLNLISNAFKFTFEGEIAIRMQRVGNSAELQVRDTGVGIPAHEMPRLFERFHRIPNIRSRTFEGTGIGLALVYELVKLHGGAIRAESAVGQGTTFIVDIPLGRKHLPADQVDGSSGESSTAVGAAPFMQEALSWLPDVPASPAELAVPADDMPSRPPHVQVVSPAGKTPSADRSRVILADDNSDMRQYVARLLGESFDVHTVSDGGAALAAAREHPPEAIVSDVMMPRVDGLSLLRELRADPVLKEIPVIFLSARAGEESRVEGIQAGADDYLVKPFSARELLASVNAHVKMHRMRLESRRVQQELAAEYETLLNRAPVGIYLIDSDFRFRLVNPVARPVFRSISNLIGRDFEEVIRILWPKDFADEMISIFRHALKTGESYSAPERGERREDTGAVEYYEWRIDRIRLPEGSFGVVAYFRDVTAEVKTRNAIAESEERFRAIVETTPECVKLVNSAGRVLHMNAVGVAMLEADRIDQVIGQNIYGSIAPEYREQYRAFNERVCRGERGSFTFEIVGFRGKRRHVETYAAPLLQADGSYIQLGVTRDVTDRVLAERNKDLLAAIVGSSDDAIISKDIDGFITSWNDAAERIFGYSAIEAIGRHITLIIPDDRLTEENDIIARIRRGERVDHYETVRKRKDGLLLDISLTISPIRDAAGRVAGASKVARDISDRKRAEDRERRFTEESVAANAKFRAIFEQTTQFAGIMQNDGLLVDANRLSVESCGFGREEVLGRPFWQTAWWRNFPESQEKIRRAIPLVARGVPYRENLKYSHNDGTERLVDFALYPIRDQQGRVLYLHPTGVDITEQKQAEENYRNLTQRLEQEVRLRTAELERQNAQVNRQADLLRDLSQRLMRAQDEERRHIARELHDSSGQLLTALAINLSQIVRRADDKKFALASTADESLQIVRQLSQEIRTMSYLLHPPLLEETGIAEALAWYIDGFNQRSGIEINLRLETELDRFSTDTELAIFRIVQEALTNIHRHSGSSNGEIRLAQRGDEICVWIQDQGKGMPAEKLAEINSGASGVGFRGMRERVHQLHGKMKVESDTSGTRLTITFPVVGVDQAGDPQQPASARRHSAA